MTFITVLVIGLTTGLLASLFMGGASYRIARNIAGAVVGAFLATWLFGGVNTGALVGGRDGPILVAFMGAVGLLLVLRMLRPAWRAGERWTRSATRSRAWRSVARSH